jgi:hypothetical protein
VVIVVIVVIVIIVMVVMLLVRRSSVRIVVMVVVMVGRSSLRRRGRGRIGESQGRIGFIVQVSIGAVRGTSKEIGKPAPLGIGADYGG